MLVRVDKRFWVPDHSHQAGDYMRADAEKLGGTGVRAGAVAGVGERSSSSEEGRDSSGAGRDEGRFRREESKLANMVAPEEEIFDDDHEEAEAEAVAHQLPVKATERGVGRAV